jgi:ABC-type nitrate/sulfonate/bicarbonate transport system substrate-binding protein
MRKRVQDERPARTARAQEWVEENVAEQQKRHAAIMKEMNEDLAPQRARWYQEFLDIVSTKGFNANGDMRVVIGKAELPKKPKRKDQVVY